MWVFSFSKIYYLPTQFANRGIRKLIFSIMQLIVWRVKDSQIAKQLFGLTAFCKKEINNYAWKRDVNNKHVQYFEHWSLSGWPILSPTLLIAEGQFDCNILFVRAMESWILADCLVEPDYQIPLPSKLGWLGFGDRDELSMELRLIARETDRQTGRQRETERERERERICTKQKWEGICNL